MTMYDVFVLVGPALTAGFASWIGVKMQVARLEARLEGQERRLSQVETDARYAHQRINDLPCRQAH